MALTPEEQRELDQLEAQYGGQSSQFAPSLTPAELQELQELEAQENQPSFGRKALDYGLRALDYTGGLTRTAAAELADSVPQSNEAVTSEDWMKALRGKAPSSAEYMERMGVPEGARVDLNPFAEGDSSVRDIGGFVGDVALDPLNYLTLGGSAAAKAGSKVLNPSSQLLKKAGKATYKSGFKNIDGDLAEKGVKELSEVLWENGAPSGTLKRIAGKTEKLSDQLLNKRKILYDKIDNAGGKVDVTGAVYKTQDMGKEMLRRNPALDDQVGLMDGWLAKYGEQGSGIPVSLASDYKTTLYQGMPNSAYSPIGKQLPVPKAYQKEFAKNLKEGIINAGNRAGDGLGNQVDDINENLSSILTAQKKAIPREIKKGTRVNTISPIDTGMGAWAMLNPGTGGWVLAAKKTGDLAKTTAARTVVGKGMNRAGQSTVPDMLLRRSLINANDDENQMSPWMNLGK